MVSDHNAAEKVEIRRMTLEDLDEILEIEHSSFGSPWSRDMFKAELRSRISLSLVAVFREKDREYIAGYVNFWMVADEFHLNSIAVRRDLRRRGIASLLMAEVIRTAKMNGAVCGTLEVRKSNAAALSMYEKFGFLIKGIRPLYYTDTMEDALILWVDI
ncbi:MAG: ribosomal protein S18-alanine N-acetyltransferase [Syntrophales bacterium]